MKKLLTILFFTLLVCPIQAQSLVRSGLYLGDTGNVIKTSAKNDTLYIIAGTDTIMITADSTYISSLLHINDSLVVDHGVLTVSNTDKEVGINTLSPRVDLHVDDATSHATFRLSSPVASNAGFQMYRNDTHTGYAINRDGITGSNNLNFNFDNAENSRQITIISLTQEGDLVVGDTTGTSANSGKTIMFSEKANDPTPAANTAGIYAKTVSASAEVFAIDEAGNASQLSPHDPITGEWIFYSKNIFTGRVVRVNMEELVRDLSHLTGKNYLQEWYE